MRGEKKDICVSAHSTSYSYLNMPKKIDIQKVWRKMNPRCPTICTTCFHIILKGPLPAEPTLSVSPEDPQRPPTVPPSPATGQGPGQAPFGSLDNGSTAGSANNNSTEATVEDSDVEFALSDTAAMYRKVGGTLQCRRNKQKKPGSITLRLKRGPHSATTTHCLCGQANSGDHCHSSSMY